MLKLRVDDTNSIDYENGSFVLINNNNESTSIDNEQAGNIYTDTIIRLDRLVVKNDLIWLHIAAKYTSDSSVETNLFNLLDSVLYKGQTLYYNDNEILFSDGILKVRPVRDEDKDPNNINTEEENILLNKSFYAVLQDIILSENMNNRVPVLKDLALLEDARR